MVENVVRSVGNSRAGAILVFAALASLPTACSKVDLECVNDADCDDAVFCNGVERCEVRQGEGVCAAGVALACAEAFGTCGGRCNELSQTCVAVNPGTDADGDGHASFLCDGDDCDDTDATRYPGNTELCDDHDEDCNDATLGPDVDGDGSASFACCNPQPDGLLSCGFDCDDTRATINSTAVESCNGVDDDCDGVIDEGLSVPLYLDFDGDGYGVAGNTVEDCPGVPGFSILGNDCNDKNAAITPGTMVCDVSIATQVNLCTNTGLFTALNCPAQQTCRAQPNGTGFCL